MHRLIEATSRNRHGVVSPSVFRAKPRENLLISVDKGGIARNSITRHWAVVTSRKGPRTEPPVFTAVVTLQLQKYWELLLRIYHFIESPLNPNHHLADYYDYITDLECRRLQRETMDWIGNQLLSNGHAYDEFSLVECTTALQAFAFAPIVPAPPAIPAPPMVATPPVVAESLVVVE